MSIYILAALRTPVGALGGSLRGLSAVDLGAAVLRGLLARTGAGGRVREVVLGQTVQAGCGPNPAQAAATAAGLAAGSCAWTVNQGPLSSLQAVLQAARTLADGGGLVLAGGMESCSSAPYLLPTARWGTRMGEAPVLDALLQDGGEAAPGPGPEAQPISGLEACLPLNLRSRRGPDRVLTQDDARAASGLADAAAGLLLGSAPGPQPALARLLGHGWGAGPAEAAQAALDRSGLALDAIGCFELETAFPGVPEARCNLGGGALAPGRAAGADGARMLVRLAHHLHPGGPRHGLACLASPGGPALALILERP